MVHFKTLSITDLYIPLYGLRIGLKCIKPSVHENIQFHIQQFIVFSKRDEFFSLGNPENLSSKQIVANAEIFWLQELSTSLKHIGK